MHQLYEKEKYNIEIETTKHYKYISSFRGYYY